MRNKMPRVRGRCPQPMQHLDSVSSKLSKRRELHTQSCPRWTGFDLCTRGSDPLPHGLAGDLQSISWCFFHPRRRGRPERLTGSDPVNPRSSPSARCSLRSRSFEDVESGLMIPVERTRGQHPKFSWGGPKKVLDLFTPEISKRLLWHILPESWRAMRARKNGVWLGRRTEDARRSHEISKVARLRVQGPG